MVENCDKTILLNKIYNDMVQIHLYCPSCMVELAPKGQIKRLKVCYSLFCKTFMLF